MVALRADDDGTVPAPRPATADNTMYSVRQHDRHPGDPEIVHHTGKALSRA